MGNARSSVHDNSPVLETVCRKVQILKPPIQWKIFIEDDLIEHACAYEQIAAISQLALAVLMFSNVVQRCCSCRLAVYTRVTLHSIDNNEARGNNHILGFIKNILHAFDEIRSDLHVIIQE